MQGLRLSRDADHRPGVRGPRIRLAVPQLAVETDAAELPGDRQVLSAARRYRHRVCALGIVEPTREILPLRVIVADETDVELAIGRIGHWRQPQPRSDQRDRG